jgi:hypothetical protein
VPAALSVDCLDEGFCLTFGSGRKAAGDFVLISPPPAKTGNIRRVRALNFRTAKRVVILCVSDL